MIDSIPGTMISLLLPLLLGSTWVLLLLRNIPDKNLAMVLGHGYLLGTFLVTLFLRLWFYTGLPPNFWLMATVLLALVALGGLAAGFEAISRIVLASKPARLAAWEYVLITILLILLAWRYSTLAQEILLRPLFPWDAWMNWAPKAVVWHYYQDLVPFVSPGEWLRADASTLSYTEGAGNAWKYPISIPLSQLWVMLGAGVADHTVIYLPWLFVALALGLTLYGHFRLCKVSMVLAVTGCYILLSLPYLNVHVALAGYADIWVTAAFGCAIMALYQWSKTQQYQFLLIALLQAAFCSQLKIPGIILGGIVVAVALFKLLDRLGKSGNVIKVGGFVVLGYFAAFGMEVDIPGVGLLAASRDGITLPYIGNYVFTYHSVHEAMRNTIFMMINWNILAYLFVLVFTVLIVKTIRNIRNFQSPAPDALSLFFLLVFVFFVYYFTDRYVFAQDYSQVNRALIYSTPVVVFYIFRQLSDWSGIMKNNRCQ